MDFTLNISIFYQCKIAENGYEIKNGKITTRFNNSRYMLKNFNLDCIKDFKSSIFLIFFFGKILLNKANK